jgi:hypothetical protein
VAYGISDIYKDAGMGGLVQKMKEIVCKGGYPTMKRLNYDAFALFHLFFIGFLNWCHAGVKGLP